MLRERITPSSEVIRARFLEDSPFCGVPHLDARRVHLEIPQLLQETSARGLQERRHAGEAAISRVLDGACGPRQLWSSEPSRSPPSTGHSG